MHRTPRYASITAHPGSVEHIVDDRPWSDLSDDQRAASYIDDELDATWANPAWQVNSTTRQCCYGIGDHTTDCTVPATLAAVTAPVDAQHVEEWRDDFGTGEYDRHFRGTCRNVGGVTLALTGFQAADGTARRNVHIFAADVHLDQAALRTLAAHALAAADELDQLAPIAYALTDQLGS